MAQRFTVSVPDSLAERIEVYKDRISPSQLFQDAISRRISELEEQDNAISGDGILCYKDWHISVTHVPGYGHFYVVTEPGQTPTGILPGLPIETLDECVEMAKQLIGSKIEQKGGAAM